MPKLITIRDEEKVKKITKSNTFEIPGPGAYDTDLKTIEKSL